MQPGGADRNHKRQKGAEMCVKAREVQVELTGELKKLGKK